MKRIAFVAALCVGMALPALAEPQPVTVPPPKCEPKPVVPGPAMRQEASVRKRFERDVKEWENCMKAYLDERNAVVKANTDAANAAVKEFNETIKALNEAQKAS